VQTTNQQNLANHWITPGVRLALLALMATSACHEHVQLRAPDQVASLEARVESYGQLRPLSMHQTHTTYLQGGVAVGSASRTDYLQLANGKRVYHAEDLLPLVPETSPTAVAAREAASKQATANTLIGVGITANVVGAGVMVGGIFSGMGEGNSLGSAMPYIITGGVIVIAGSVMNLVSGSYRRSANDESTTAFTTYDASLRQRLGICLLNDQIIACPDGRLPRAPQPAAPPPVAPAAPPQPSTSPAPASPVEPEPPMPLSI